MIHCGSPRRDVCSKTSGGASLRKIAQTTYKSSYVAETTQIDPATGWPIEFEAAARLGFPDRMFAILVIRETKDNAHVDRVWVCKLVRTRGRKAGRGSAGKRRYREWWHPYAEVQEPDASATDWFSFSQSISRAERLKLQIFRSAAMPDTVHILWEDPDDDATQDQTDPEDSPGPR